VTEPTKEQQLEWIAEARRLLVLFQDPIWAATAEQTDQMHLTDYCETLDKTRKHFNLPEETPMHAVMGKGDVIYAYTGNSPTSADRAKAIVGFILTMPFLLDAVEALIDRKDRQDGSEMTISENKIEHSR
jgi:hypothetical protein